MSVECLSLDLTDNPDSRVLGHATLYMSKLKLKLEVKLLKSDTKGFSLVPPSRRDIADTEWVSMFEWDDEVKGRWFLQAREAVEQKMNDLNETPDNDYQEEELPF